jgi:hypothetical protein
MRAMLLLVLLLAHAAQAAEPRTYAVLSLVGDKLMVARYEIATGSRLDKNPRRMIDLPDTSFDRAMVFAVEDAIRKAEPGAKVVLLMANDPAIYAAQSATAEAGAAASHVMAAIRPMLAAAGASHLVLVTKHRSDARIKLREGFIGSGTLEGLGFYIDDDTPVFNLGSLEGRKGFLAPFVHVRFSLVDLADSRTLREEPSTAANAVVNPKGTAVWESLSGDEKARLLQSMLRRQAARAVPRLLAP